MWELSIVTGAESGLLFLLSKSEFDEQEGSKEEEQQEEESANHEEFRKLLHYCVPTAWLQNKRKFLQELGQ